MTTPRTRSRRLLLAVCLGFAVSLVALVPFGEQGSSEESPTFQGRGASLPSAPGREEPPQPAAPRPAPLPDAGSGALAGVCAPAPESSVDTSSLESWVAARLEAIAGEGLAGLQSERGAALVAQIEARPVPAATALLGIFERGGDSAVRYLAGVLLLDMGDARILPIATRLLGDPSEPLLRRLASHVVGTLGGEQAIRLLDQIAAGDPDWIVRYNAASHLARLENPRGLEVLRLMAEDESGGVREFAVSALAEFAEPESGIVFRQILESPDPAQPGILLAALEGVRALGDSGALPLVEALVEREGEFLAVGAEDVARAARDTRDELASPSLR